MRFSLEPSWMHSDFDSVVVVDDDSFLGLLGLMFILLIVLAPSSIECDWISLITTPHREGTDSHPNFRTVPKRKEFAFNRFNTSYQHFRIIMGKKCKRNKAVSTKQNGTRNVEGGVSETRAVGGIEPPRGTNSSINTTSRDIEQTLSKLLQINDYEGILKLESDAIRQAKSLEGTEPLYASYIYIVIAKALTETGSSNKVARHKTIRLLERSFTLAAKMDDNLKICIMLRSAVKEGRHVEAFATVKRLASGTPQHELTDPDMILSMANKFSRVTEPRIVVNILTIFLGTINRFWDKDKRAVAYLAFGGEYTFLFEYEKAASFLHKALDITDDPERKVTVLGELSSMFRFSCNYDAALSTLNDAM
jgi:hypothetical protein